MTLMTSLKRQGKPLSTVSDFKYSEEANEKAKQDIQDYCLNFFDDSIITADGFELAFLGWFYEPTLLDRVPLLDAAVQQEIFGPVLCIQTFADMEEAVHLANGTQFGLVAGVFTKDLSAAHRLAQQIDAGQVYVNEYFAGGIAVPFGGNKHSGFGREKGLEAVGSYCKTKSVVARI